MIHPTWATLHYDLLLNREQGMAALAWFPTEPEFEPVTAFRTAACPESPKTCA